MDEQSIFLEALTIPAPERIRWLDQVCNEDEGLKKRISHLIKQHEKSEHLLENPPHHLPSRQTVEQKPNVSLANLEPNGPDDNREVVLDVNQRGALHSIAITLDEVPQISLQDPEFDDENPISRPHSSENPIQTPANRYHLDGEIARGGMGAVIKGRDTDLGRDLAIKVLLDKHKDNPQVIQRFIEEAQIGGQLQHPGIAPIYELGQFADQRPFFSMKLVKGRTLAKLLAERKQIEADRVKFIGIFEQVCQTMSYAHSRGVIHRDLKPANIMVGAFGEVQVMDWGLAKVVSTGGVVDEQKSGVTEDGQSIIRTLRSGVGTKGFAENSSKGSTISETQLGSVMGTPAYMPIEQALGEVDQLDYRSDVFALGSILCEILTGTPAYSGKDGNEVYRLACRGELDPCFQRLGSCNADKSLVDLTRECLSHEPKNRPANAGAVADGVVAYQALVEEKLLDTEIQRAAQEARATAESLQAKAERERANEEIKRRRITIAFAASLLIMVSLGGGWMLWSAQTDLKREKETALKMKQSRDLQRKLAYSAEMNVASQSWVDGDVENVRSLLNRHLPTDEVDLRKFEWFHYNNLVSIIHEHKKTKASLQQNYRPKLEFHSANNQVLAYDRSGGLVFDYEANRTRNFTELLPASHMVEPEWFASSSGNHIVTKTSGAVTLWELSGSNLKKVGNFNSPNLAVKHATLSKDKKTIAFIGRKHDGDRSFLRVEFRDVNTGGSEFKPIQLDQPMEKPRLLLSPEMKHLLVYSQISKNAYLFPIQTPQLPRVIFKEGNFRDPVFSSNGKLLLALSNQESNDGAKDVSVWTVDEIQNERKLSGHRSAIKNLAVFKSKWAATTSMDHRVIIWDLQNLQPLKTLKRHTNWTAGVAFSPNGQFLVTGGADQQLILWKTEIWDIVDILKGHTGQIVAAKFSADSNTIASMSAPDDTIHVWPNIKQPRRPCRIQAQKQVADVVALSADGEIAATAGREGSINVWNLSNGKRLFQLLPSEPRKRYHRYVYPAFRVLAISPDNQSLAIVTDEKGSIEVWDIKKKCAKRRNHIATRIRSKLHYVFARWSVFRFRI